MSPNVGAEVIMITTQNAFLILTWKTPSGQILFAADNLARPPRTSGDQ